MKRYAKFGIKDFVVALGFKSHFIKEFFLNFSKIQSDFTIDLSTGEVVTISREAPEWKVTLVDTGLDTMTGGRLKRLASHLDSTFCLTYGDGIADIDIKALLSFHRSKNKEATITAVRPVARFGELEIKNDLVKSFQEKPQTNTGWINGGFFVFEPTVLDKIEGDLTVLEREPLEALANSAQLVSFKHEGFWQCMDTKRDVDFLREIWESGKAPWL